MSYSDLFRVLFVVLLLLHLQIAQQQTVSKSKQFIRTSKTSFRKGRQIQMGNMMEIWCTPGHVGLNEVVLMRRSPISGCKNLITLGQYYTLVIELHFNDQQQLDFLLEECVCNQMSPFIGNGCLHRNNQWVEMTETVVDGTKFVLIYFVAPATSLHFECRARVFQCCGCCQNVCNRSPPIGAASFPSTVVPISFSLPLLPPASPSMPQLPPSADCWFLLSPPSTSCSNPRLSIWALCLLLFLLLLLLLLIVCCALSLCFGIGWRFQDKIWPRKVSKTDEIRALPTFSPEPFSHPPARTIPAVVNESSQTMAPQTPPWDSEWGEQQNQKKKEWEKERHVALPLRELTKKDRAIEETWWKLEENIQTEEEQTEEVISTEWREGEEAMWRKKDEWTARGQWNGVEAEEEHQRQQEERRHYENWSRPAATSDRFHHAPVAWTTHFGKEPMAAVLAGEEEDRIEWRTTEPNGATVREGGTTKYRQKSTF